MATPEQNLRTANRVHAMRIAQLERRIDEIREQAASATVSDGGGSKSYSNHQIAQLRAEINEHRSAIVRNNARMNGGVVRRVYIGRR